MAKNWITPTFKDASSNGAAPPTSIWDGTPTDWLELREPTYSFIRFARKITLNDVTIDKLRFFLKKGTGAGHDPICARIRKTSDDSIIKESPDIYYADELSEEGAWVDFSFKQYINEEVYLSIEYDGQYSRVVAIGCIDDVFPYGNGWAYDAEENKWDGIIIVPCLQIVYFSYGANTIDDDLETFWVPSPENEINPWISWDIGSLKLIDGCRIYWGSDTNYIPSAYHIQTSTDNINWTTVRTLTEAPPAGQWVEYFWNEDYARYIKIIVDLSLIHI